MKTFRMNLANATTCAPFPAEAVEANHFALAARNASNRRFGYDSEASVRFVVEKALPLRGHVLDIGTGKGRFVIPLARHVSHVTTVDINAGEQRVAQLEATSFYDWPEGAAMLGGLFDGHPWGAGGTWAFKLDESAHPLNRAWGGKGFKLQDEIYQFKAPYTRADRRVLVSLDLSDAATGDVEKGVKRTDRDFAIAWIKNYGQGRVFYCGFGHAANVFQDPSVVRFYLDGIQFALGDLVVDASPRKLPSQ